MVLEVQERYNMTIPRTKTNKLVVLTCYTEIIKHYICKGCSKWFSIADILTDPSHCPNCGKIVKEIECTK